MLSKVCLRDIDCKKLVYIAYIGTYKEPTYKYGMTKNVLQRFATHRRMFDVFEPRFVYPTLHYDYVEEMLEKELKFRDIHRSMVIHTKRHTELFVTNDTYTLSCVDRIVKSTLKSIDTNSKTVRDIELSKLELEKLKMRVRLKEYEYKILRLQQNAT